MLRFIRIPVALLCLAWLGFMSLPGFAQSPAEMTMAQTDSMPRWTVPVLRLVSATHVEPTTGVVISDSGMVLVPADFAGPGDEIIVLDGGTDIIRNGKPAKIAQRFSSEGVQVLSVTGLRRQGASFSSSPIVDGSAVRLVAFPPAELIAQGKPPLDILTAVVVPAENGKPLISGEAPLPNVSGALVDACGNLAGYSAANGVQSMSTTESPGYQWKDSLLRLMQEMQISPKEVSCENSSETTAEEAPPPDPVQAVEVQAPPEPETEQAAPEPEADTAEEAPEAESEDAPEATSPESTDETPEEAESLPQAEDESAEILDAGEQPFPDPPPEEPGLSAWLWLLVALLLASLAGVLWWLRKRLGGELASGQDHSSTLHSSEGVDESDDPGPETPGLDSKLLISGLMADGKSFDISLPVSANAMNLVIGRGNADISIESTAISRRHAIMNGSAGLLTLSDLGSSNGTSINGVPCLEGETMYISPGDTILVGDACFNFEIVNDTARQVPE